MLVIEPESRLSIPEILSHPFVHTQEDGDDEEGCEHDLKMGLSFSRQECKAAALFNPFNVDPAADQSTK